MGHVNALTLTFGELISQATGSDGQHDDELSVSD